MTRAEGLAFATGAHDKLVLGNSPAELLHSSVTARLSASVKRDER